MLRPIPNDEYFRDDGEIPEPPLPVASASRAEIETCLTCPLPTCTPMRGECPLRAIAFILPLNDFPRKLKQIIRTRFGAGFIHT